ncbi:MAG: MBL fold metallo-hydrolase [Bacteroidales bacterium]
MKRYFQIILIMCTAAGSFPAKAQGEVKPAFKVIITGSGGGIEEDNLNSYLLAGINSNDFIMLDAGTLVSGIEKAVNGGSFYDVFVPPQQGVTKTEYIFRHLIRAYLISHPHLDHVSGLVIGSPADTSKSVYASAHTIEVMKKHLFNWEVWPNFANEGEGYALGTYTYRTLRPGQPERIKGTAFEVTAFPVSHQEPYESTAFLISRYGEYVLYVGDTGPDEIEEKNHLSSLWLEIAPLISENRLHAIFIECSYPSDRPDAQLYGHLNPQWLARELGRLAGEVDELNPGTTINGLKVVVTGIKPTFDGDAGYLIHRQLLERNEYGVQYIIPEQGQRIEF